MTNPSQENLTISLLLVNIRRLFHRAGTLKTILLVVLVVVSLLLTEVNVTKANPEVYASMPSFKIISPLNTTYPTNPVVFKVQAVVPKSGYTGGTNPTLFCYLDGKGIAIEGELKSQTKSVVRFIGETSLNLTAGKHTFSAYHISCAEIGTMYYPTVEFSTTAELKLPNPMPASPSIVAWYSPSILHVEIASRDDNNKCTRQAWYSLDGQEKISIPLTFNGMISLGSSQASLVSGQANTPELSGSHTIDVSATYNYGTFVLTGEKILYLGRQQPTLTPHPPAITIISPKNQATYGNQVPITYSINSDIIWSYYALDSNDKPTSKDWKSFHGNITLSGLPEGTHKLMLSVKPEGQYTFPLSEETVVFSVASSPNSSSVASSNGNQEILVLSAIIITLILLVLSVTVFVWVRVKSSNFD